MCRLEIFDSSLKQFYRITHQSHGSVAVGTQQAAEFTRFVVVI